MTFEVPGVNRLLLARWFLGSAVTGLADFPPELVAELHPDLAKVGPLGLLVPLDSLHYWSSRAASQGRPSFPVRLCNVSGGLS